MALYPPPYVPAKLFLDTTYTIASSRLRNDRMLRDRKEHDLITAEQTLPRIQTMIIPATRPRCTLRLMPNAAHP